MSKIIKPKIKFKKYLGNEYLFLIKINRINNYKPSNNIIKNHYYFLIMNDHFILR